MLLKHNKATKDYYWNPTDSLRYLLLSCQIAIINEKLQKIQDFQRVRSCSDRGLSYSTRQNRPHPAKILQRAKEDKELDEKGEKTMIINLGLISSRKSGAEVAIL